MRFRALMFGLFMTSLLVASGCRTGGCCRPRCGPGAGGGMWPPPVTVPDPGGPRTTPPMFDAEIAARFREEFREFAKEGESCNRLKLLSQIYAAAAAAPPPHQATIQSRCKACARSLGFLEADNVYCSANDGDACCLCVVGAHADAMGGLWAQCSTKLGHGHGGG